MKAMAILITVLTLGFLLTLLARAIARRARENSGQAGGSGAEGGFWSGADGPGHCSDGDAGCGGDGGGE